VDSAREQEKLEAREMLVDRAKSPPSTARFVGRFWDYENLARLSRIASRISTLEIGSFMLRTSKGDVF
jgi:hypothetical protein